MGGLLRREWQVLARNRAQVINPLAFLSDAGRYVIIASFAGADHHPPWYHNLVAEPNVTVEVGADTIEMTATVVDEPERSALYAKVAADMPIFDEYQSRTDRVIPVVVLTPR